MLMKQKSLPLVPLYQTLFEPLKRNGRPLRVPVLQVSNVILAVVLQKKLQNLAVLLEAIHVLLERDRRKLLLKHTLLVRNGKARKVLKLAQALDVPVTFQKLVVLIKNGILLHYEVVLKDYKCSYVGIS